MDIQHLENYLLAPIHSSRCTSGVTIDSGYDISTKVGDTVAGIDSSSKECVLGQPDPDNSEILHTTKIEHIRSVDGKFHCHLCPAKFKRAHILRSHLRIHSGDRPFVCTICSKTFAHTHARTHHEGLHSSETKLVCRGELSAQPARAWGCGRHFASAADLAQHFNSQGNVGRVCIMSLLDKAVGKAGIYPFPSVLLTQYPVLKDFKLVHLSPWQDAPTWGNSGLSRNEGGYAARQNAPSGRKSGLSHNHSGYESVLHLDPSETLSISPAQVEAQTEGTQKALPYYGSLSSLESQVKPSPPWSNLQDLADNLSQVSDRPETSEDSDNSLVETIPCGDEPDCKGFSQGIELSGHQVDLQGTSDSEGRLNYKVHHVSKENTFAQEKAWTKDGNGHLSDSISPDQSSTNSGSENEYDDTSEASILDCSQRALIARLMDEICSSFFYQISHRPRQRGQGGQGSREASSSSTEQTITTISFIDGLHGSRRKRSHKKDEDPEDEDNGEYKRPRNQNTDDDHSKKARNFACPFHQFDASTYSSGNADPRVGLKYRCCGPPGWPNIGKLK